MQIATILPVKDLEMRRDRDYNMALAHLVDVKAYREFFRSQSDDGKFVLMDNGVVETGVPMPIAELLDRAETIGATEMVLPDMLRNKDETLRLGREAMTAIFADPRQTKFSLLAVPQGSTKEEWRECVLEMLTWPVKAIGISRFVNAYYDHRKDALADVPELLASNKEIHLLGCAGDPKEMWEIEEAHGHGRIRGVDSGIASIYAQAGKKMSGRTKKPDNELDFLTDDTSGDELLKYNVEWWEKRVRGEV